jgi:hypothetical protein
MDNPGDYSLMWNWIASGENRSVALLLTQRPHGAAITVQLNDGDKAAAHFTNLNVDGTPPFYATREAIQKAFILAVQEIAKRQPAEPARTS